MIVIATGMDNTGKTTLCGQLVKHYGLKLIKSPGPGLSLEDKREWVWDALSKDSVIYDRFNPLEELVYGPILRPQEPLPFTLEELIEILSKAPVKIIYTRPSREAIFNFGDRPQMDGVISQKIQLLNSWDSLMAKLTNSGCLDMVRYNYEEPLPASILKYFLERK